MRPPRKKYANRVGSRAEGLKAKIDITQHVTSAEVVEVDADSKNLNLLSIPDSPVSNKLLGFFVVYTPMFRLL